MKEIRQSLNLSVLKRSKVKKHNKIHEKAHRLMMDGFETTELSEAEIMEIASRFPTLSVNVLMGGDISVKSFKDNWLIRDEVRFYTLYHKGTSFDKGRMKDHFHIQDIFKDLSYIFASIVSHDDYDLGIRKLTPKEVEVLAQA